MQHNKLKVSGPESVTQAHIQMLKRGTVISLNLRKLKHSNALFMT